MWWQWLRAQFPLCQRRAYLFSGAQAPLADPVRDALLRFLDEWAEDAWRMQEKAWAHVDSAAANLARVIGCRPEQVVLTESTSSAMSLGAAAVLARVRHDPARTANVVIDPASHPASTYPWLNARRLGIELEIRVPHTRHDTVVEEQLAALIDERTIALVVSHVDYATGARRDLTHLARGERRNAALLVDAAQSAGAIGIRDVLAVADFVAMPAYKWLLGPPGVAFLIVSLEQLADPGPPQIGWAAAADPMRLRPFELELAAGGRGWRMGMANFGGVAAANAALGVAREAEPARIEERITALVGRALERAHAGGLTGPTPSAPQQRAGIVALDVGEPLPIVQALSLHGYEVGYASQRLRVDPHAFNSEDEIDRVIAEVSELCSRRTVSRKEQR